MIVVVANTRADAKAQGLKRYATGKPCRRGHLSERITRSGDCAACKALTDAAYASANADKIAQRLAQWKAANRDHLNQWFRRYYREHREQHLVHTRRWAEANAARVKAAIEANWPARRASAKKYRSANQELVKARAKKYLQENKHISAAKTARRRSQILNATARWANHEAIKKMYELAATLGMHVDHEIPLVNERVCGLHVETNLRLLTPRENMVKGNRFIEELL